MLRFVKLDVCRELVKEFTVKLQIITHLFFLQKRAARNEQYLVSQGLLGLGFGTSEECEAVLQTKYMSEEEEGNDPVTGGYFRTVVPSWRSEEVCCITWSFHIWY